MGFQEDSPFRRFYPDEPFGRILSFLIRFATTPINMRRATCLLAPLIVIGYLYLQWSDWFTRIELQTVWKRPLISDPIDLGNKGSIEWLVPKEGWIIKDGEANLALSMNKDTLPEFLAKNGPLNLRVKVRAQGRVPGMEWQDRLVRDEYFKTDEPFSNEGTNLWNSGGLGRLEYRMTRVRIVAGEELRINIDVLVPDGKLHQGIPRLKLVGRYVPPEIPYTRIFRGLLHDGGYWLSILMVISLGWYSWPLKTNP